MQMKLGRFVQSHTVLIFTTSDCKLTDRDALPYKVSLISKTNTDMSDVSL